MRILRQRQEEREEYEDSGSSLGFWEWLDEVHPLAKVNPLDIVTASRYSHALADHWEVDRAAVLECIRLATRRRRNELVLDVAGGNQKEAVHWPVA